MFGSRVLVVEDNHEVRRMVTASLKTLGDDIEVLEVPSAEEALVVSASQPLDLIVLDISLPGMSGLEMVARLRKRKPNLKIILVTGVQDDEIRKQVAEADVCAYFFKPIEIQAFLEAVKGCLSTAQLPAKPPSTSAAKSAAPITSQPAAQTAPISPTRLAARPAAKDTPSTEPAGEESANPIYERLNTLKKHIKAVAALLVNDSGQIIDEAGIASDIATGSPLLLALMRAFRTSLQVSQAMARGTSESLQYFAAPRQCIYVSPVGMSHCLFVVTSGYFGPDKLGMLYHSIHLAVRDLEEILAQEPAGERDHSRTELPPVVAIDKETLARVDGMFSQASNLGGRQRAEGFWENVEKSGAADITPAKDTLSTSQAHDLGQPPKADDQH